MALEEGEKEGDEMPGFFPCFFFSGQTEINFLLMVMIIESKGKKRETEDIWIALDLITKKCSLTCFVVEG